MAILIMITIVTITFLIYGKIYKNHTFDGISYNCYFKDVEVYQGEEILFIEEVSNNKYLPVSWLKAELTTSKYLNFSDKCSAVTYKSRFVSSCYAIGGNKSVKREWKISASKRGVFSIDNVVLNSCNIFGENEVSKPINDIHTKVTVLPLEVDTPEVDTYIMGIIGNFEIRKNLLTDVFSMRGIREYTGHERLNRIHWKDSAKQSKMMVIEENYTSNINIIVYLYINENCEETLAEKTLSTACTIAVRLSERDIPTKMDTNCNTSTISSFGKGHALNIKRFCAELDLTPKTFNIPTVDSNSILVIVTPIKNKDILKNSTNEMNQRLVFVRL